MADKGFVGQRERRQGGGDGGGNEGDVEKDGHRFGGRADPDKGVTLKRSADGDRVILEFQEDIQELKSVHMAANPFLPVSLIQQPKCQFLFAPAKWGLKASLKMNLARLQILNLNMGSDFLAGQNGSGLWAQSQIVVVPGSTTMDISTLRRPWTRTYASDGFCERGLR